MPKLLRSIYAGGYSDEKKRRLQSYKLPLRIKCAVCHKIKAVNFFSTIQQLELQNGMATGQVGNPAVEEWVPCVSCTPKQVTELECCICEEVKDLNGFAKAQRRLGENARCITCVTMLNGDTPIEGSYSEHLKEQLREDSDDSDSEYGSSNPYQSSTSGDDSNAGVLLSSSSGYDIGKEDLGSLTLSSDNQGSKPSASYAPTSTSAIATKRTRAPKGAEKWQNYAKENSKEPVETGKRAEFTGFDREGKAHQIVRPASTVDSDEDSDDTVADPREQARIAKEEREARSRFARIPGGRGAPVVIPTYVGGKTVPDYKADYDDDGDDDDDWGTI